MGTFSNFYDPGPGSTGCTVRSNAAASVCVGTMAGAASSPSQPSLHCQATSAAGLGGNQGTKVERFGAVIFQSVYLYVMVQKPHLYDPGIYFVTFTNYKWLPLFSQTNAYDLVYKWFDLLQKKGHSIIGYVIMPNHVHALIGFKTEKMSVNTTVGNGKRFIAYDIVERLKEANNDKILNVLAKGVSLSDKRRGKLHEVFEGTFDIKLCYSYKFVQQKLDYMHSNPVSKKWSLVKEPIDYMHSSARYYVTGEHGMYTVTDANDWINADWFEELKQNL